MNSNKSDMEYINTGNKDTRSGFGAGLAELGRTNPDVVALCADLTGSLKMDEFASEHPDRFFQCGIQEANMVDVAAGLSLNGRIPFVGSFANFVTARVYDQLRQCVAYGNTNVKIAASHAGITLGGVCFRALSSLIRAIIISAGLRPWRRRRGKALSISVSEGLPSLILHRRRPVLR